MSLAVLININTAFAIVGSLAAISTVALILITRVYYQYIHRLQLYLAIACFFFAVSVGFETLPVQVTVGPNISIAAVREGWKDSCVAIGFLAQYFGFAKSFSVLWICIYVFMAAVYERQLRQLKYEISGLVFIFALPVAITWIPLLHGSYGLMGIWCWIKQPLDNIAIAYVLGISHGLVMVIYFVSLMLLIIAVVRLCKGQLAAQSSHVYKAALREILPLTIYPSLSSIASVISASKSIFDVTVHGSKPGEANVNETVVVSFLQTLVLSIPLSLLLYPRLRSNIAHLGLKSATAAALSSESRADLSHPATSSQIEAVVENTPFLSLSPRAVDT